MMVSNATPLIAGLPVIGTAGLLVRAKDRRLIAAVRPLLTRMQERGMRYSQRFFESLMEQLGE
jgi:predicted nucleic acid-binding protein